MFIGESVVPTSCIILYWPTVVPRLLLVSTGKQKLEMTKCSYSGDAYTTTLAHIWVQKGGRSRSGMDSLIRVSDSEVPLQTSKLCYALGVKIESTDLDVENVPEIRTILGPSLELITVKHPPLPPDLSTSPYASVCLVITQACPGALT